MSATAQVRVEGSNEAVAINTTIGSRTFHSPTLSSSSSSSGPSVVSHDTISSVTTLSSSSSSSSSSSTGTADHASYQYLFVYTSRGRLLCVRWPNFTVLWETILLPEGWHNIASSSAESHQTMDPAAGKETTQPHKHSRAVEHQHNTASHSDVPPTAAPENEKVNAATRPPLPPALASLLDGWGALIPSPAAPNPSYNGSVVRSSRHPHPHHSSCHPGPPNSWTSPSQHRLDDAPRMTRHAGHTPMPSPHSSPHSSRDSRSSVFGVSPQASIHTQDAPPPHSTGWSVSAMSNGAAQRVSSLSATSLVGEAVDRTGGVTAIRDANGNCCWASMPTATPCWGPFTWWHRRRVSRCSHSHSSRSANRQSRGSQNGGAPAESPDAAIVQHPTNSYPPESDADVEPPPPSTISHPKDQVDQKGEMGSMVRGPVSNWKQKAERKYAARNVQGSPFVLANANHTKNKRGSLPDNDSGRMKWRSHHHHPHAEGGESESSDTTHTAPPTPSPNHPIKMSSTMSSWAGAGPMDGGVSGTRGGVDSSTTISFISLAEVLSSRSAAVGSMAPTEVTQRFGSASPPPPPKVSLRMLPLQQNQELYAEIGLQDGVVMHMFPPPTPLSTLTGAVGSSFVHLDAAKAAQSRRHHSNASDIKTVEYPVPDSMAVFSGRVRPDQDKVAGDAALNDNTIVSMTPKAFPSTATVHIGLRFQVQQTCVMATTSSSGSASTHASVPKTSTEGLPDAEPSHRPHHHHHPPTKDFSSTTTTTSVLWLRTCALQQVIPTVYLNTGAQSLGTHHPHSKENPANRWEDAAADDDEEEEESHFFSSSTSSFSSSSSSSSLNVPAASSSSSSSFSARGALGGALDHNNNNNNKEKKQCAFTVPPLPLSDLIQCYPHGIQVHYRTEDLLSLSMQTASALTPSSGATNTSRPRSNSSCSVDESEEMENNPTTRPLPDSSPAPGGGAALPKLLSPAPPHSPSSTSHLFWPLPSTKTTRRSYSPAETSRGKSEPRRSASKSHTPPTLTRGSSMVSHDAVSTPERKTDSPESIQERHRVKYKRGEVEFEDLEEEEEEEEAIVQAFFFRLTFVPQNSTAASVVPSGTPSVVYRHRGTTPPNSTDPARDSVTCQAGLDERVPTPEKLATGTTSLSSVCGPAAVCWELWALPVAPPLPETAAPSTTPPAGTESSFTLFSSPPKKEGQRPASFHLGPGGSDADVKHHHTDGLSPHPRKQSHLDPTCGLHPPVALPFLQTRPCTMLGPRIPCAPPDEGKPLRDASQKKGKSKRKPNRASLAGTWTPMQASHHLFVAKRKERLNGVWWCPGLIRLAKKLEKQNYWAGPNNEKEEEKERVKLFSPVRFPPTGIHNGSSAGKSISLIYGFPAPVLASASTLRRNDRMKNSKSHTAVKSNSGPQLNRSKTLARKSTNDDQWNMPPIMEHSRTNNTEKKKDREEKYPKLNSNDNYDHQNNNTNNNDNDNDNSHNQQGRTKSPLHWMRSSIEPGRSASAPYHHSSGFSAGAGSVNVINRNPGHGHRTSSRHKNHHDRRNSSMNSGSVGVPRWSTSFVDHSFLLDDRGGAGGSYHLPMASASTFSESPEQSQHHRRRPPTSGAAAGVPPSAAPPLPHPAAAVHQTASQALGRSSDERQAGMMAFEDPSDPVTQTDDGGSTTSPAPDWVGVHPAGFTSPSTAMCTTASQSSCPSPCHPIPGGTESFHTAHPVLQPVAVSHSHPRPHHNGYSAGRRMDQGNDFHSSNNANYSHPSSSNHHHNGNTSNNNNNNNGFTMSYFEQNFEPLRLLGRGAYGAAILSRHRMSGKYYAVKVLLVHDYDSERDVLQEVRVHAALSCKYLVQYHNSWSEIITPQRAMELSSIGVVPKQQKGKALWKAYQEARRHRPAHDHHHHDGVQQHPSQEAVHESSLVVHQPSSFRGSSPSRYSAGSLTPSSVTPGTTFRGYTSPVAPYHSLPFSGGSSGYGSPLPVFPAGAMAATGGRAVLSPPSLRASGGLLPQLVNPVSSSSLSPVRPLHEDFAAAALPHTWSYILDDDDDGVGGYLQGTDDDEEEEETSSLSSNSSSRSTNTSSVTTWGRTPRESSSSSSSSRPPQASTLPSQSLVLMNMRAVFIQMQLCQLTLAEHLGNRKAIDRIENLVIMLQLCTGLLYIHDRGILHRDVKPTNIFLDYSGRFTAASTTLSEDDDEEEEQLDWATGRFRTSVTAAEDVDDEDGLPLAGVGKSGSYHVVPHRHSKQLDSPLRLYTAAFCGTGRFPAFTLAASQRHHQHQRQRRRAGRRGSNEADAAVGDDPLDLDDLLGTINDNDEDEEDYSYVMGAAERGGLGGLASFCGGENSEVVDGRFCSSLARLPSFASPNASSIFSPSIQSPRQFVMPQLPNPWVTGAGGSLSDSFAPRAAPSEATREEIRELLRTMRAGPGEDTATFIQNHREELLRRWRHRLNSSGVSQVHQGSRLLARWLMRHLVHAMLGDFGLAKLHVQQRPQFLNGGMIFSMKDANTKGVGSPLYASPEQLRGDICTCSSDAFSLALVMAEMYLLPTTAAERLDVLQKTRNRRYPTSDVIQKYPELSVIPLLTRENPMTRVPLRDLRKYLFGMLQKCLNDELNSYVRGAQ